MPRIAGAYFSETEEHVGAGGTRKAVVTRVHWFVVIMDDGRHVVQPLNAENMPGGFKRIVARDDFLADFAPDPDHFNRYLRPVLESLKAKIGRNEGYVDLNQLSEQERLVYKALQIDDKLGKTSAPAAGKHRIVRELLDCIPVMEEGLFDFQCAVNAKSIELRKSGDYERAIRFFHKALRIRPDDDHLLFNLARAYWHNGEPDRCSEQLALALVLNPDFTEARRFADYLERATRKPRRLPEACRVRPAPVAPDVQVDLGLDDVQADDEWGIDRRRAARVPLDTTTFCTVLVGNRECASRIHDLSELGARLECSEITSLAAGQRIVLMERPGRLNEVLGMRKADVVWLTGGQFGVSFVTPLDVNARELGEMLAR